MATGGCVACSRGAAKMESPCQRRSCVQLSWLPEGMEPVLEELLKNCIMQSIVEIFLSAKDMCYQGSVTQFLWGVLPTKGFLWLSWVCSCFQSQTLTGFSPKDIWMSPTHQDSQIFPNKKLKNNWFGPNQQLHNSQICCGDVRSIKDALLYKGQPCLHLQIPTFQSPSQMTGSCSHHSQLPCLVW